MKINYSLLFVLVTIFFCTTATSQQIIPLYEGAIPNGKPSADKERTDENGNIFHSSIPQLEVFLPAKQNLLHTALLICPGGGYSGLVMCGDMENVIRKFNDLGIVCFLLKYRLPDSTIMPDPSIGPIEDAQQALKIIRSDATKWKIDPANIGVIGFSAGGHLAATLATHFDTSYILNDEHVSLRPDFVILIFPIISMADSVTHAGSKRALLGDKPSPAKVYEFSDELHVTRQTPPTFLMHASDDEMVPVNNSLLFYNALLKNDVLAGMHIFPKGRHGFLIEPAKSNYLNYCILWLRENQLLSK